MALNQLFNSPLLSKSPKLRQNKISAAKISPLKSFKIDTDVLRAPSIPKPGEGVKEPNLILRELVETNTILREVQNQLALDFANRIVEKEKDLKLQKSLLAKRRAKDKEDSVEGKIGKDSSFLKKSFDKVTKPVKGIFDRIKEFLTALAAAITASAAFEWLKDPANREKLENFFKWVGDHWKWIVGIIAGGLLLNGILNIVGALSGVGALIRSFWPRGPRGPGGGLPGGGCLSFLCEGATVSAFALSSLIAAAGIGFWDWLKKGLPKLGLPDWVTNPKGEPVWQGAFAIDGWKTFASITAFGIAVWNFLRSLDLKLVNLETDGQLIASTNPEQASIFVTQEQFSTAWSSIQTALSGLVPRIEGLETATRDIGNTITTAISNHWENIKTAVTEYVTGGGLKADFDATMSTLGSMVTWIGEFAWLIVGGIAAGIINAILGGDIVPVPVMGGADGGTVSDILARKEFAKGGPVRKKKSCCKSCMGFSAGKFEEGGKTKGPSHAQGGIPIEVEGGEFITKASSVNPLTEPLLRDINDNGARMWTAFAGAVEKQGQNNLKQMEINNDFSDFLKKYRNVAAGINPGAVHGMGGPSPDTPLKLKPFSSSTLTTGEEVPSELLELGTIWRDGILRHRETDQPFTYADLNRILERQSLIASRGDITNLQVIPHSSDTLNNLQNNNSSTTIVNDSKVVDPISLASNNSSGEVPQRSGSRGGDITIQTFDSENRWILKALDLYEVEPSLWLGGAV